MTTYNFPNHRKGDTFKARQIVLGFNITGATIKMQFRLAGASNVSFEWSTVGSTFVVTDAATGTITMNKRILDFKPATYVYDFQITDSNGDVTTYFQGSILIEQDITL